MWQKKMLFLSVFVVIIVIYLVCLNYEKIHTFSISLKMDGPSGIPIIGNGLLFINKSSSEKFDIINKLIKQYGEFLRIWIGPISLNVLVSNPKDLEVCWNFIMNYITILRLEILKFCITKLWTYIEYCICINMKSIKSKQIISDANKSGFYGSVLKSYQHEYL